MKYCSIILYCVIIHLIFNSSHAQSIVISEYYNSNSVSNEWSELLVIKDNLNLCGYSIRDNAGSSGIPDNWQGGVRFKDIPLWQHLRAGTIIILHHRGTDLIDINPKDGYIELGIENVDYFEKRCWGCNLVFNWITDALNIAMTCDIIQILDSNDNNVHSLAHIPNITKTGDWNNITGFKSGFIGSIKSLSSVSIVPGNSIDAYSSGLNNDSVSSDTIHITKGLPNNSALWNNFNQLFWRSLRQPTWLSPTLKTIIYKNSINLLWNKSDDNYSKDSTQGYLILRYLASMESNVTIPIDGKIYSVNDSLGSAKVITNILYSQDTIYNDIINIPCDISYKYRVYSYRYKSDDLKLDSLITNARGRQYNETNFAESSAIKNSPTIPTITHNQNLDGVICNGDSIELDAVVANTQDIDKYEWYINSQLILNCNKSYIYAKDSGLYSVKIITKCGCSSSSKQISIKLIDKPIPHIYYNNSLITKDTCISICKGDLIALSVKGSSYISWLKDNQFINNYSQSLSITSDGVYSAYLYSKYNNNIICTDSTIKIKINIIDIKITYNTDTLDCIINGTKNYIDTSIVIKNNSNDSIIFKATDIILPSEIQILSPQFPIIISRNSIDSLDIRITLPSAGSYLDSIKFTNNCNYIKFLIVKCFKDYSQITANPITIDFGNNLLCDTLQLDSIITIINTGSNDVSLLIPEIPNNSPISIVSPTFPQDLKSNDSMKVIVKFASNKEIDFSDVILFSYRINDIVNYISISIKGKAFKPQFELSCKDTIVIPKISNCDNQKDTIISITNTSKVNINIIDYTKNNNFDVFGLPLELLPNESKTITLNIHPQNTGIITFQTQLMAKECGLNKNLIIIVTKAGFSASLADTVINFDTIVSCNSSSIIIKYDTLKIENDTNSSSTISNVLFCYGGNFFETSLNKDMILTNGNNLFTIKFNNINDGYFEDTLVIQLSNCNIQKRIILKAFRITPNLKFDFNIINCGNLTLPNSSTQTITFTNNNLLPILINSIDNINPPFYLLDTFLFPITVFPDSILNIKIGYFPTIPKNDSLIITVNIDEPCDSLVNIALIGSAEKPKFTDTLFAYIGTYHAQPSEIINIPIVCKLISFDSIKISDIYMRLKYNSNILTPINVITGDGLKNAVQNKPNWIDDKQGLLTIYQSINLSENISDGNYFIISYEALWSDTSSTSLIIDSIYLSSNSNLKLFTTDGKVYIDGICNSNNKITDKNGNLLIYLINNIKFNNYYTILINTSIDESVKIDIYNLLGEKIENIFDGYLKSGQNYFTFNTSNYPNGIYYIKLNISNDIKFFKIHK